MLAIGRRPQLLTPGASPQGCLSVGTTWQVTSPRDSDSRDKMEAAIYDLASEVTLHNLHNFLVVVQSAYIVWQETTQVCEYQGVRTVMNPFEGWTPQLV